MSALNKVTPLMTSQMFYLNASGYSSTVQKSFFNSCWVRNLILNISVPAKEKGRFKYDLSEGHVKEPTEYDIK